MTERTRHLLGLGAALLTVGANNARAQSLAACGDIHVEADAECKIEVEGGCDVLCEPVTFQAACSADLEVDCRGMCTAEAEVDCTASCQGSCEAECEVEPASWDCKAECTAEIDASCEASCEGRASDNMAMGECLASCRATFESNCSARCEPTAGKLDCVANCQACCSGQCEASARVDCQIDCQATGYVDCYSRLEGGCTAECQKPEGALFCDGNYVDHGDNLEMCTDALREALAIEVDASASGSASCEGGMCAAEGEASVGCAAVPFTRSDLPVTVAFGGLGLASLVAARRRRR
jgi:hypothetical protein